MPDITQRIADIIGEHYYAATIQGPMCWCGATLSGIDQHPAHVAEVLTTELGLTREERTRDDGMGSTTVAWRPCTRQERWVTAWTVTEFSANA